MTATPTLIVVSDHVEAKRFEARVDGELVGVMDYIPLPGKIIVTHTEMDAQHEGKGYGTQLVAAVVDHLRGDGLRLQPLCPYVASWLRRHPEQADIIDPATPY